MSKETNNEALLFQKSNYIIMAAGVAIILVGLVLMSGGGTTDPTQFNGEELFSFQRLTLAPITMLAGFGVVFYSIWKK